MDNGTMLTLMAGAISALFGLLIKVLMDRAAEYKAERDEALDELKKQNTTLADLVSFIKGNPPRGS